MQAPPEWEEISVLPLRPPSLSLFPGLIAEDSETEQMRKGNGTTPRSKPGFISFPSSEANKEEGRTSQGAS